jgi:hypothetical protein
MISIAQREFKEIETLDEEELEAGWPRPRAALQHFPQMAENGHTPVASGIGEYHSGAKSVDWLSSLLEDAVEAIWIIACA